MIVCSSILMPLELVQQLPLLASARRKFVGYHVFGFMITVNLDRLLAGWGLHRRWHGHIWLPESGHLRVVCLLNHSLGVIV